MAGLEATEPALTIRPARVSDERAVHAIHAGCFSALFAGLLGDYVAPTEQRAERERSWSGPLGSPRDRHALLVAEHCGRMIGLVAVGPTRDRGDDPLTTGELRTVMVNDEARGMGAGRALLAAGEQFMQHHEFCIAKLWVVPQNSQAVRCYVRSGWRPDGAERLMDIGGHAIRSVRYRKRLAS